MRIYIAGASAERTMIATFMAAVRQAGGEITFDWVKAIEEANKLDSDLTHSEATECALLDLQGVDDADLLWHVIPTNNSKGSWVEYGYALAKNKPVITSGARNGCIFSSLSAMHFPDHATALNAVIAYINR